MVLCLLTFCNNVLTFSTTINLLRHQNHTFTFLHPLTQLPRWKQRRHILGARLGGKVQGRSRRVLVVAIGRHRWDFFSWVLTKRKSIGAIVSTALTVKVAKKVEAVEIRIRKIDSPEKRIKIRWKPKTLCSKSRCSTP